MYLLVTKKKTFAVFAEKWRALIDYDKKKSTNQAFRVGVQKAARKSAQSFSEIGPAKSRVDMQSLSERIQVVAIWFG